MILFRVQATWARRGRQGKIDLVVIAKDAIEALRQSWLPESACDLRDVEITWLTPVDCVTNREALIKEAAKDEIKRLRAVVAAADLVVSQTNSDVAYQLHDGLIEAIGAAEAAGGE